MTDRRQYTRLQHALRDICIAVVKLACPAEADTETVKNAWANDVARAMDDEHFTAERDDADVGRSLVRSLQIAFEKSTQGSVVRHTILGVLRTLAGVDDEGGRLAGQQPRSVFVQRRNVLLAILRSHGTLQSRCGRTRISTRLR